MSSICLYAAGMVLNDTYDVAEDRVGRPERPLPRGHISFVNAHAAGLLLLAIGLVLAGFSGWHENGFDQQPGRVAVALAFSVWLYNIWAKRTVVGPVVMGLCRGQNVLLGATVAGVALDESALVPAAACALYIGGLTWFARDDARLSRRTHLAMAGLIVAGALVWAASALLAEKAWLALGLLAVLAMYVGQAMARAVAQPDAGPVRAAVGRLLLGYIPFSTAWAVGFSGPAGWCSLLLIPVMIGLRRYLAARLT
jgi:4-hydroxybenzoate polyprenyltransferase